MATPMNCEIELHDSMINAITFDGSDVIVAFLHAYIHESPGKPGIDSGIGLSQWAEIRISNGKIMPCLPRTPVMIVDGKIVLEDSTFTNLMPTALDNHGRTNVILLVYDDKSEFTQLSISGDGIQIQVLGEATYVEDFPGL